MGRIRRYWLGSTLGVRIVIVLALAGGGRGLATALADVPPMLNAAGGHDAGWWARQALMSVIAAGFLTAGAFVPAALLRARSRGLQWLGIAGLDVLVLFYFGLVSGDTDPPTVAFLWLLIGLYVVVLILSLARMVRSPDVPHGAAAPPPV